MSASSSVAASFTVRQASVRVFPAADAAGVAAAQLTAEILATAIARVGRARIIVATGPSQQELVSALVSLPAINWAAIEVLHMDEYIGISADHPASFRGWLRARIGDRVQAATVHYLNGSAADVDGEAERYSGLLASAPVDVCLVGFGENGHIAFNEPGAAVFEDSVLVRRVVLDERTRAQQVGEGHFGSIETVLVEALTITCTAIMRCANLICFVPELRKAEAVRHALEGPVSRECPASLVTTHPRSHIFLDHGSASLLSSSRFAAPCAKTTP